VGLRINIQDLVRVALRPNYITASPSRVGPFLFGGFLEPEVALWRAVIARAIKDAKGELESCYWTPKAQRRAIQDAQNWFLRADFGFEAICYAAELVPEDVRARVIEKITFCPLPDARRAA